MNQSQLNELNRIISEVVPIQDLNAVKKALKMNKLIVTKGGAKRRKRKIRNQKRRSKRGGGKLVRLTVLILIIGICITAFNGYCDMKVRTTTVLELQDSSVFHGIFYCNEFNVYQKHLLTLYSIYGRPTGMRVVQQVLELAKNEIFRLYAPVTGVGIIATIGSVFSRNKSNKEVSEVKKFNLLKNKVEQIEKKIENMPPNPKKPWKNYNRISNPEGGRLVKVNLLTGLKILNMYNTQTVSKIITYPYICNPHTGLWMDIRSEIGKDIIKKYIDKRK